MKHAPTPYRIQPYVDGIDILDADGLPVAHIADRAIHMIDIPPSNSAFIVRACNCHDELVAAMTAMLDTHGMHGPCKMNNCSECKHARSKATLAIAKATGVTP